MLERRNLAGRRSTLLRWPAAIRLKNALISAISAFNFLFSALLSAALFLAKIPFTSIPEGLLRATVFRVMTEPDNWTPRRRDDTTAERLRSWACEPWSPSRLLQSPAGISRGRRLARFQLPRVSHTTRMQPTRQSATQEPGAAPISASDLWPPTSVFGRRRPNQGIPGLSRVFQAMKPPSPPSPIRPFPQKGLRRRSAGSAGHPLR